MKRWLIFIILLLVGIGLAIWHWQKPIKPLPTMSVGYGNITQTATAIGDIEPVQTTTVKSQVAGIVKHIYHDIGDYVNKGDKLADLNPYPPPVVTAQDIKNIKTDQANLDAAQESYNSYHYLYQQKVIPQNYTQYVAAKQNLATIKAALAFDQQKYQLDLKGTTVINGKVIGSTIVSPISGFILQKMISVGDSINSLSDQQAATVLFTMANMKDLIFKGAVDEMDAGKVKAKMPATLTVAAFPQLRLPGVVSVVSLQSQQLNSIQVNSQANDASAVAFDNGFNIQVNHIVIPKNVKLRSGYSATASIIVKQAKHVLLVPESALIFKADKTYVALPLPQHKTQLQLIKTGITDGINIQVLSGLHAGETIVATPSSLPH